MKKVVFTIISLIIIFTSCENNSDESPKIVKGFYDYMHFDRSGGGQIDFQLFKTEDSNKLIAIVSKYNSRDTIIQLLIDKNLDNTTSFSDLDKALNNQIQLNGDFVESALPTGTWAVINFCNSNEQSQVTNTDLRSSLLKFERLIKNKIE